ncbi:MAG: transposase, partial [Phycisphaerae bacterium]
DYVVIAHTQTRGGHHVRAWLGDPDDDEPRKLRFLQCDEYAGYDALLVGENTPSSAAATLKRVGCFAHARRKFHDLRDSHPVHANAALAHIQRLYAIEAELTALRDEADPAVPLDYPAWHETRRRVRQEHAVPLLDAYFDECRKTLADLPLPRHPVAAAARYSLNQEADLRRYVEHGVLEIDNNACERSIRPLCLGKKNWLFTGSPDASRAAAVIFSLVASVTRHGKNPHAYLEHLLQSLRPLGPDPSDKALDPLLPDRWTPRPRGNTADEQGVVG